MGARAQRLPQHVKEVIQGRDDARDVRQEAFCTSAYKCNLVATDIFVYCPSSTGAGAPPRPLLVPLSQKPSSARGPGPRRVERSLTYPVDGICYTALSLRETQTQHSPQSSKTPLSLDGICYLEPRPPLHPNSN